MNCEVLTQNSDNKIYNCKMLNQNFKTHIRNDEKSDTRCKHTILRKIVCVVMSVCFQRSALIASHPLWKEKVEIVMFYQTVCMSFFFFFEVC